jgi:excisionase family DNA binding protein
LRRRSQQFFKSHRHEVITSWFFHAVLEATMEVAKQLLSPNQFWAALNEAGIPIGRHTVRRAVGDGSIKHFRIGNRALIPRSELDDWPQRLLEEPETKK